MSASSFDLSPRKRALLEKLLNAEGVCPAGMPRIARRAAEGPIPVSFAQERLWFLEQLEPGRPIYNIPQAVRFRGPIDAELLRRVFQEIVERHETLRTTFTVLDGRPVQVIAPVMRVELPVTDLSHLHDPGREAEARRLATDEAQTPFDLACGPLLRIRLLRLGPDEQILLWTMHHIVSDGWSAGIFMREAATLYDAFSRGLRSPLPELPIQYADFAVGQREWLQGEILETQLDYWRNRLGGGREELQLPTDRPRPPKPSWRGSHEGFVLPRDLALKLRALGRREGATLFMVLLAAFKAQLHRYTGQEEISVGTLIANRNRVETEALIGFFANTLVLRTSLSGDPPFRELLARVREVTLGAYTHQDLPFEKLVEVLRPGRDPARNPLFDVMFVLQNAPSGDVGFGGIDLTPVGAHTGTSRFDLSLAISDVDPDLHGWLEYRTDLFDTATIVRMIGHWVTLLESIAADPDERIANLTVLASAERDRLLIEWNDTGREYPRGVCVHDLFKAQAARTPDADAVVLENGALSYGQLERRAEQLAAHLRAEGIGPDSVVGVSLEPSFEVIVAVLGALKAGGACLPIDPAHPKERQAFMLEESRAALVLTRRALLSSLPACSAKLLCIDDRPTARPPAAPASWRRPSPGNLAYVIYTSGSTGRPKAVGMPHSALVNLVEWHESAPRRSRRTLQFASLCFDVSFEEIFSTFRSGGTLVLVPAASRADLLALGRIMDEQRVERAHLPNVILQRLAEEFASRPGTLESLREIMVGGEQLRITPAIADLFGRLGRCRLHNHYGPSETHVMTSHVLEGEPPAWPALPPIGRPISNATVYLLDRRMRPAPVGVAGEMCIGGDCVARGYLNRPDLTAERFLPDPFGGRPGARLYRSGDICRRRPDGAVEFIGRADHQVKIRGVRLEPGEIEIVLARHAAVKEAAVVAHVAHVTREKRLVAYVVPASGQTVDSAELRRHLRDHLPEIMIPAAFVVRETLPRTTSGKVDRAALPPPDETSLESTAPFVAPRTPVEERIASIWMQCLDVGRVGVNDSFFELGGHSLLATQVLTRIREAFQVEIPLRGFFETPTIAQLARLVGEAEGMEDAGATAGAIRPRTRDRSLDHLVREIEELSDEAVRDRLSEGGEKGAS